MPGSNHVCWHVHAGRRERADIAYGIKYSTCNSFMHSSIRTLTLPFFLSSRFLPSLLCVGGPFSFPFVLFFFSFLFVFLFASFSSNIGAISSGVENLSVTQAAGVR